MLTTAVGAQASAQDRLPASAVIGERFADFLTRVSNEETAQTRRALVSQMLARVQRSRHALVEDSTVCFLYAGRAARVSVAGDLNGWSTRADTMTRLQGTDLFYLVKTVPPAARFEYKFVVDSTMILDPYNQQQAMGGFGPNSEIWMPAYKPSDDVIEHAGVPRGNIDTLAFESTVLGRTYPVFVYTPHLPAGTKAERLPVLVVTDGGEYLSLGLMNIVLDNLIAQGRIAPVVAVFADPRTDVRKASTNTRMADYAMSDTFVTFLREELIPRVRTSYPVTDDPRSTAIMGASLGALIATYAAYTHPEVFGLCAAQSPAFWWNDNAIVTLIQQGPARQIRFYLDTGTIHDAQDQARRMRDVLSEKGYALHYAEYPEGHNWVNWRSRISDILTYFWGTH